MVDVRIENLLEGEIKSDSNIVFDDTFTRRDTPAHINDLSLHTGVLTGLELTANTTTTFDIAVGEGIIVDRNTDPLNPIVTRITGGVTGITDPFILTDPISFVYLDNTNTPIVRNTTIDSIATLNDEIFLGQVSHFGGVISGFDDNPIIAFGSSSSHIAELVFAGGVNLEGAALSANGSNLLVNISAGILEQYGRGRAQNKNSPNEYTSSAQTPISAFQFFKVFINTLGNLDIEDFGTNTLDAQQINLNGAGTLTSVSPNRYSVQHVFEAAGTEGVLFYYGTQEYTTAALAVNATEPTFVEHPQTRLLSPIAKIVIQQGMADFAADIASGDAVIIPLTRRV